MYELLLHKISETVPLTEDDREIIKRHFTPKKLKKKQFLLQEGDVANRLAFVEKGALYSYSTDSKGARHIIQFAFEGWWISDLYSYFTKEPSKLAIEVLEECELLLMDYGQQQALLKSCPAFETYTRTLYQNAYIALQGRIENTIGLSTEEKYARLAEQYPMIPNRVPLHLIASYLGVTPETLSRIRKQIAR
ncbi:MAG: cyclic nucleotide-binding domain-containing protein [Puia sp.]|nr:cyclic nucleotide-binding domain-containing protein [Puia sp.]